MAISGRLQGRIKIRVLSIPNKKGNPNRCLQGIPKECTDLFTDCQHHEHGGSRRL